MEKKIITLCYRKIIDANSTSPWDKLVFEDSYREFKLQAQVFNAEKKYHTFAQLVHHNQAAEKLHFLVSGAVTSYLKQLNEKIPDIANNIGLQFLTFKGFRFELINSDLRDISKHRVAINFYSQPLIWHDTIGTYLLTSAVGGQGPELLTDLFALQPYLTIYSLT